jgi:Domain of unknown function (DUF6457)
MTDPQEPDVLDAWVADAAELLGLDPQEVPIGTVLELARRVAHAVARPAAPVTTFLLGLAVGAGGSDDLAGLADRIAALAESRGADDDPASPVGH